MPRYLNPPGKFWGEVPSASRPSQIRILLLLVLVVALLGGAPASSMAAENRPPSPPVLISPPADGFFSSASTTLKVQVSDPDNDPLNVTFYAKPLSFTLVHIPDTQRIISTKGLDGIATWIVNHRIDKNIPYAVQTGDITEGDLATEWQAASTAMAILENPATTGLADGVPYGILPGNHDALTNFNTYFGVSRFNGRAYYSGHFPSDSNQNSYTLFSAGGMDFIAINVRDGARQDEVTWADNLLATYSNRRGIVSTHGLFPWVGAPAWNQWGQAFFNALSDNPNLFLMLSGHCRMEAWRQDVGSHGNTIYSLAADFTDSLSDNIRLLEFSPSENKIHVRTYSPKNNVYETDADSQFDLAYDMSGAGFGALGTVTGVASGSTAEKTLYNLVNGVEYQWYVEVSDGVTTTTSPIWDFTNSSTPPTCYALTLSHTGQGSNPVASPARSNGCATGRYTAGTNIALSGATPNTGWTISGWTGTANDSSTDSTNSVTMPAAAHTVTVNYEATNVDITPPETDITDGPDALTNDTAASFTFTSSETPSTFECKLDAAAFTPCTSPRDYPALGDGEHTFQVAATDAADNTDPTPASYTWIVDATGPVLTVTGATADGDAMDGTLEEGYILDTTNNPGLDRTVQLAAGTVANEPLTDTYFGLYLVDATVTGTELQDYYTARGVPEPYLGYLMGAAVGTNPFVYIKGTTVTLVDAAKHSIQGLDVDMTVPDDFPLGTYTVRGVITDLLGNESEVTLILVVAGDHTPHEPVAPVVSIARDGDDADLTWPIVNTNTVGSFTTVTQYQTFMSVQPYFTPDPTPDTGNLAPEDDDTDLEYLHTGAAASAAHYFYFVRAVNGVGPSVNSNHVGVFTFALVAGDTP